MDTFTTSPIIPCASPKITAGGPVGVDMGDLTENSNPGCEIA